MPYVFHIKGDLNVDAFKNAIEEIVNRHEALRTVFSDVNAEPLQVIQQVPEFLFPVFDLQSLSEENLLREATRLILEERRKPFALNIGPLFRAKLLRMTNANYFLLVTTHHITSDEWSMRIFQRELAILYRAFSTGAASPLSEVRVQFADFAAWERNAIENGLFDDQLDYWRKELSSTPILPRLGNDKDANDNSNKAVKFDVSHEQIEIGESLFAQVRKLSQEEDSTPLMVFMTVLNMVIHIYAGQTDIRLGIVTANREGRAREDVMGNFTNTIILRTQIDPSVTVRELLKQVRDKAATGYSNQELPFEYMIKTLDRNECERQSTQFTVQVIYNNVIDQTEFAGLSFAPFSIRRLGIGPEFAISDADMIFRLQELTTKVTGALTYKTRAVDQCAAARIIDMFESILMRICGTNQILSPIFSAYVSAVGAHE
jgi:NRPS condensation-like uncharacterized protein